MNTAIIIGFIILGVCLIGCAFILSGAITGAAKALKNDNETQLLQQPTMRFLTEFDAADYLGISLAELDFMRDEGMLDNTFIAVTALEQTGEEEYTTYEDGVQVSKVRPVMSHVVRFLFNTELLDKRMIELISEGKTVNPTTRNRKSEKKNNSFEKKPKNEKPAVKEPEIIESLKDDDEEEDFRKHRDDVEKRHNADDNDERPAKDVAEQRKERPAKDGQEERKERPAQPQNKPQGNRPNGGNQQNRPQRPNPNGGNRPNGGNQQNRPPRPQKPINDEDDSDMKIVGAPGKKPVRPEQHKSINVNASPAFDPDDADYTAGRPAQKGISKPKIARINNDNDD